MGRNKIVTPGGTRARGRARLARCLVPLTAVLLSSTALAQGAAQPPFELERLELNPNGAGTLGVSTGELLGEGQWRVGLLGHYQNDPLVFYVDGVREGSVVEHRVMGHLVGAWAPLKWLELNAQVPVVLWQQGQALSGPGVPRVGTTGLSTPLLAARAAVLSQRGEAPVDLALELGVGLPVGSPEVFGLESGVRLVPRVMVGRRFEGLRAGLEVAALTRRPVVLGDEREVQDELGNELRLGAVVATTGNGLRGELNVRGAVPFGRTPYASMEVLGGVRLPLGGSLEAFALGGPGIGRAPGTPTFRLLLGVAFDSSGPLCVPGAPHRPADCPELDLDGDGVRNGADSCPREGGKVDASGCPVKDADGDGVEDAQDTCPSEAGLAERQGCPVRDADKDGLEDDKDACPSEAGLAERKGCPVRDADQDGVEDARDACPNEAGPAELRGCPPKDSDGDEVVDLLDNCPSEKGVKENQGCPAKQKQLVTIRQDRLDIKGVVLFDTGKSTIKKQSFGLLDQVAKVLREHPEIRKLDVEGHTDNVGQAEDNRKLSQSRAEAVKTYLAGKGVEASRMAAKGYGPDRPVADNATAKGRAANRRVEFIITTGEVQQ
jgi:OmpA-OmpF porin, OOP family